MNIIFNQSYIIANAASLFKEIDEQIHTSGNGPFTKKCHKIFEDTFNLKKPLLTTSCTSALEMAALLMDIMPGDEVIVPAYTFVSTANAFALRGAKIVFADSCTNHPNIDLDNIEQLITKKTKALVVVHYGGIPCDLDKALEICKKHSLFLIEDAAQAIGSTYKGKQVGTFGDFSTFSFHESKNISCGEGGLLCINNKQYVDRAKILWEKGTNRSAFFEGRVNKYEWLDIGSSYTPSEYNAAILYSQLLDFNLIQSKRREVFESYSNELHVDWIDVKYDYESNNHIFYLLFDDNLKFIEYMHKNGVQVLSHYLALNNSPYSIKMKWQNECINAVKFETNLVRLPIHHYLSDNDINKIINLVKSF